MLLGAIRIIFACQILVGAALYSAQEQKFPFGKVTLECSGSPEARETFLEGVAALHCFEFKEAVIRFKKARELDPSFALTYWGEALACTQSLGVVQDMDTARAILEKLGSNAEERAAKCKLPIEKGLVGSLELLYGFGTLREREERYSEYMQDLYRQYPHCLDVMSLYALSILWTGEANDYEHRSQIEAAGVIDCFYGWNPPKDALKHPGALHYYIHALDDPIHAVLAFKAAEVLGGVAPESIHAMHMPSHIYTQLGMWDKALKINENAFAASQKKVEKTTKNPTDLDFHTLYWLGYLNLQTGRYSQARSNIELISKVADKSGECTIQGYKELIFARYIVETGDTFFPIDYDKLSFLKDCYVAEEPESYAYLYAAGLCALRKKEVSSFDKVVARLIDCKTALEHPLEGDLNEISDKEKEYRIALLIIEIAELNAIKDMAEGDNSMALQRIERAANIERNLPVTSGMPYPVQSALELYADVLLAQKKWNEAEKAYKEVFKRIPNRPKCFLGLARTAVGLGDVDRAVKYYRLFTDIWAEADPSLPEYKEAREFLDTH